MAELSGEVAALSAWTTPLAATSGEITSDIADINNLLPTVTGLVNSLQDDILAEKIKIAVLQQKEDAATDLESRIVSLEGSVPSALQDVTDRVGTLEGKVSTLQ